MGSRVLRIRYGSRNRNYTEVVEHFSMQSNFGIHFFCNRETVILEVHWKCRDLLIAEERIEELKLRHKNRLRYQFGFRQPGHNNGFRQPKRCIDKDT